jgi:hypothetical protein
MNYNEQLLVIDCRDFSVYWYKQGYELEVRVRWQKKQQQKNKNQWKKPFGILPLSEKKAKEPLTLNTLTEKFD